jgi:hypothetical protein
MTLISDMILICSVGSKRGYITIQSKERIVLMETKSLASIDGARLPNVLTRVVWVPMDPEAYTLQDFMAYFTTPTDGVVLNLATVELYYRGKQKGTIKDPMKAFQAYQTYVWSRGQLSRPYTIWLSLILPFARYLFATFALTEDHALEKITVA